MSAEIGEAKIVENADGDGETMGKSKKANGESPSIGSSGGSANGTSAASRAVSLKRGDVVWAPHRGCPLWPAVIRNVYRHDKKATFIFLPERKESPPATVYNCKLKTLRLFKEDDPMPEGAEMREAFEAAIEQLKANRSASPRATAATESTGRAAMRKKKLEVASKKLISSTAISSTTTTTELPGGFRGVTHTPPSASVHPKLHVAPDRLRHENVVASASANGSSPGGGLTRSSLGRGVSGVFRSPVLSVAKNDVFECEEVVWVSKTPEKDPRPAKVAEVFAHHMTVRFFPMERNLDAMKVSKSCVSKLGMPILLAAVSTCCLLQTRDEALKEALISAKTYLEKPPESERAGSSVAASAADGADADGNGDAANEPVLHKDLQEPVSPEYGYDSEGGKKQAKGNDAAGERAGKKNPAMPNSDSKNDVGENGTHSGRVKQEPSLTSPSLESRTRFAMPQLSRHSWSTLRSDVTDGHSQLEMPPVLSIAARNIRTRKAPREEEGDEKGSHSSVALDSKETSEIKRSTTSRGKSVHATIAGPSSSIRKRISSMTPTADDTAMSSKRSRKSAGDGDAKASEMPGLDRLNASLPREASSGEFRRGDVAWAAYKQWKRWPVLVTSLRGKKGYNYVFLPLDGKPIEDADRFHTPKLERFGSHSDDLTMDVSQCADPQMRAAIVEARRINAGEMDPFTSASVLRRASLTLPPMLAAADVAALAAAAGQRQSSSRRVSRPTRQSQVARPPPRTQSATHSSDDDATTTTARARREQEKLRTATLSRECMLHLDAIRNGSAESERRQAYCKPAVEDVVPVAIVDLLGRENVLRVIDSLLLRDVGTAFDPSKDVRWTYTLQVELPEALAFGIRHVRKCSMEDAKALVNRLMPPTTPQSPAPAASQDRETGQPHLSGLDHLLQAALMQREEL